MRSLLALPMMGSLGWNTASFTLPLWPAHAERRGWWGARRGRVQRNLHGQGTAGSQGRQGRAAQAGGVGEGGVGA